MNRLFGVFVGWLCKGERWVGLLSLSLSLSFQNVGAGRCCSSAERAAGARPRREERFRRLPGVCSLLQWLASSADWSSSL